MTSTEPKNNCKHTGTASFEQGFGWRCDDCGGLSGNHGGTPGGSGPASGSPGGSGLEPKKEWAERLQEEVVGMLHPAIYEMTVKFISSLLTSRDEALIAGLEGMKEKEAKKPCLNAESHLFGRCFECVKTKGWNKALDEAIALIRSSREG